MNIYTDVFNDKTDLCTLMKTYGSDKGHPDNKSRHNYTHVYSTIFTPIRMQQVRLFELGIGSINPSIRSNMGVNGRPGASLRAWRDFFLNGTIFGADIDVFCIMTEHRMKTYYCDQTNPTSIKNLWTHDPILHDEFDIIIEDGLHTFTANVCFFENSHWKLKKGGVYCIEDIETKSIAEWKKQLSVWKNNYGTRYKYRLLELASPNRSITDNNLLLIQRLE